MFSFFCDLARLKLKGPRVPRVGPGRSQGSPGAPIQSIPRVGACASVEDIFFTKRAFFHKYSLAETRMDEITKDKRFAHIVKDSRFRTLPKSERKAYIDKRFKVSAHI